MEITKKVVDKETNKKIIQKTTTGIAAGHTAVKKLLAKSSNRLR